MKHQFNLHTNHVSVASLILINEAPAAGTRDHFVFRFMVIKSWTLHVPENHTRAFPIETTRLIFSVNLIWLCVLPQAPGRLIPLFPSKFEDWLEVDIVPAVDRWTGMNTASSLDQSSDYTSPTGSHRWQMKQTTELPVIPVCCILHSRCSFR